MNDTTISEAQPRAHYYAMSWTYGVATTDDARRPGHSKRAADYVFFPSRAARDAYVAAGPAYRSERGYREALPASDAELRRALRLEALDGHHGCYVRQYEPEPSYWEGVSRDYVNSVLAKAEKAGGDL